MQLKTIQTIKYLVLNHCINYFEDKYMYEGIDISKDARIERDKYTKRATLIVEIKDPWRLYIGYTVDSIDYSKAFLTGSGRGVFPLNIDTTTRSYFSLVTQGSKIILSERLLPMSGAYNFRDIGGYRTTDGRFVKWGKLFRADELSGLAPSDLVYLDSIALKTIIDFRAVAEAKRSQDKLPPSVKFSYPLTISPGSSLSNEGTKADLQKKDISVQMELMNRSLVTDPNCINAYRKFFSILQNGLSAPAVFHCTAGKDRTGMAAALLLYALGVDRKIIMKDYMLSKTYIHDKYATFVSKYPRAKNLFTVKSAYLKSGLDQIEKDYGSIQNYLITVLNVDIEKLRRMYLY